MWFRWSILAVLLAGALSVQAALPIHTADQDSNEKISLSELLRVVQLYNSEGFSCDASTEDGFLPGAGGDTTCAPHAIDYLPQNWFISLSELLRLIQVYNAAGGYYACEGTEDGYCPRLAAYFPNVVLLVLDTLRADRLGRTRDGSLIMPFLTEFVNESRNFVNAWSPSSWTEPTMSSMFTSRYPEHFMMDITPGPGGQSTGFELEESDVTLAEILAANGFTNFGLSANAFIQPGLPLGQGFTAERYQFLNGATGKMMTDAALPLLEDFEALNAQGKPFFLFMQYMDPHGPYTPVIDFEYPFNPEPTLTGTDAVYLNYMFWTPYFRDLLYAYFGSDPVRDYANLSATGVEVLQARYDRDCYYMDYHLQRLITAIRADFPDTVFIITADHGDSMIDRGQIIGHGHSVFQEQVHVPLSFRTRHSAPEVITRRVSNMSILPTLARHLGLSADPQWEGLDLIGAELNDAPARPVFAFTRSTLFDARIEAKTVVDGDLKLIDDTHFGPVMLFDLANDPGELNNLAASRPADVSRLRGLLDAHDAAVGLE